MQDLDKILQDQWKRGEQKQTLEPLDGYFHCNFFTDRLPPISPIEQGKVNSFLFFYFFFLFLQNKKFFFRLIENRSTARCILESPALFISRLVDAIEIFLSRPLCSRPLLIQDVHRQAATVSLKARIHHALKPETTWRWCN